jgi:hypothetical protein
MCRIEQPCDSAAHGGALESIEHPFTHTGLGRNAAGPRDRQLVGTNFRIVNEQMERSEDRQHGPRISSQPGTQDFSKRGCHRSGAREKHNDCSFPLDRVVSCMDAAALAVQ